MNEIIEKEQIKIEDMIMEFREIQVMMDSDLAKLFNVETGNLNKAMKRNIERFPTEFCFQLNNDEYNSLIFQNGRAKKKGGRTNLPFVYSEQGVAMLASVLHSDIAIRMSIQIINTFVSMRHYIIHNQDVYKSLNSINNELMSQKNTVLEHENKINYIFSKFDKRERLLIQGQTFDAYSNILEIFNNAKNEIIVIDSYADIKLLDLIRNIQLNIILITRNSNRLSDIEIEKYNKQYNNLKVIRNNSFHDRYFIIDRKKIYLCGSSVNNLGDKTFMIIKLEDDTIKNILLKNVEDIIYSCY